jgi:hypothetical protein
MELNATLSKSTLFCKLEVSWAQDWNYDIRYECLGKLIKLLTLDYASEAWKL